MAAAAADLSDSTDDEEEFLGFREEDIPVNVDENDEDLSGDSDISVSESSDEESSEESDDELPEDDTWSRNLRNVHVNNFEKDTGPTNILPPEATADRFFYQLFPEDLIELIVNETNLNAEQKQRAARRQDQNWAP